MIRKKLMTKTFLAGSILCAILSMAIIAGCDGDGLHRILGGNRDSGHDTLNRDVAEREGGDSAGEHGGRPESDESGEEDSANMLALDETFDKVRGGARLILNYDAPSNAFKGTVENTTNGVLDRVRVEVHLSNGTELGPTTPTDMAPGQVIEVTLPATQESFNGWVPHAEVGGGGEAGEHSANGERGGRESGGEHRERRGD